MRAPCPQETGRAMNVIIWGGTGSLPAALRAEDVRAKLIASFDAARGRSFTTREEIERFVDTLPFANRGSYRGNTSCVELRDGHEPREFVVFDAGSGIRDFGRHIMHTVKGSCHFHVFISHLHWDYLQGFPFFMPAFIKGNCIDIYGCHQEIEAAFTRQQEPPFFPVPLSYMQASRRFTVLEPGRQYQVGGYRVMAIEQDHPGLSYGYSLEKDGKKIVYATDAEHRELPDDESGPLLDFCRNADLMLFDAQYSLIDAIDTKESWGHSSNMVGVEIAMRADVKHLCLFHNEPTQHDDMLDKTLQNARKYASQYKDTSSLKISLAYDGLDIIV